MLKAHDRFSDRVVSVNTVQQALLQYRIWDGEAVAQYGRKLYCDKSLPTYICRTITDEVDRHIFLLRKNSHPCLDKTIYMTSVYGLDHILKKVKELRNNDDVIDHICRIADEKRELQVIDPMLPGFISARYIIRANGNRSIYYYTQIVKPEGRGSVSSTEGEKYGKTEALERLLLKISRHASKHPDLWRFKG